MKIAGWTALAVVLLTIPLMRRCLRARAVPRGGEGMIDTNRLYDIEDCLM